MKLEYRSVNKFASAYTEPGRTHALGIFGRWYDWIQTNSHLAGMTPDELVDYQDNLVGRRRYEIEDEIQRWIKSLSNIRPGTLKKYYHSIRGFFLHNRAELPRDRTFKYRGDIPSVIGGFNFEEVRRMLDCRNPSNISIIGFS